MTHSGGNAYGYWNTSWPYADYNSQKANEKIYDPGNPIIIAGYENKYVFFLIEGEAEASIQNNDGTVAAVYLYKSNSIFGEVEPFYNDFNL